MLADPDTLSAPLFSAENRYNSCFRGAVVRLHKRGYALRLKLKSQDELDMSSNTIQRFFVDDTPNHSSKAGGYKEMSIFAD